MHRTELKAKGAADYDRWLNYFQQVKVFPAKMQDKISFCWMEAMWQHMTVRRGGDLLDSSEGKEVTPSVVSL